MRLLYLIKEDHRVGFTPYSLCKLATLVVSHISRRRTYKSGNGKALLILAHIYPCHHILIVKEKLCKRLGKLCLTHTGGTQKEERTYRPLLILQACTGPSHRI